MSDDDKKVHFKFNGDETTMEVSAKCAEAISEALRRNSVVHDDNPVRSFLGQPDAATLAVIEAITEVHPDCPGTDVNLPRSGKLIIKGRDTSGRS